MMKNNYIKQKRKEEIRKSIIACDNDIVKLRSQAENLEEIIKKSLIHKNQRL